MSFFYKIGIDESVCAKCEVHSNGEKQEVVSEENTGSIETHTGLCALMKSPQIHYEKVQKPKSSLFSLTEKEYLNLVFFVTESLCYEKKFNIAYTSSN